MLAYFVSAPQKVELSHKWGIFLGMILDFSDVYSHLYILEEEAQWASWRGHQDEVAELIFIVFIGSPTETAVNLY